MLSASALGTLIRSFILRSLRPLHHPLILIRFRPSNSGLHIQARCFKVTSHYFGALRIGYRYIQNAAIVATMPGE